MSFEDDNSLTVGGPNVDFNNIKWDNIEFLQIRYTDVPGRFLASYLLKDNDHLESVFRDGIGLDGSSVRGFADINESDLLLLPDMSTVRITTIPSYNIAAVIADVYRGFGQGRLSKDPRHVSQCMEGNLAENGLSCQIGSEVECFIFDDILFGNNGNKKDNLLVKRAKVMNAIVYGGFRYS